jgi:hypothetical protein
MSTPGAPKRQEPRTMTVDAAIAASRELAFVNINKNSKYLAKAYG